MDDVVPGSQVEMAQYRCVNRFKHLPFERENHEVLPWLEGVSSEDFGLIFPNTWNRGVRVRHLR